jgi:hypothetical protein
MNTGLDLIMPGDGQRRISSPLRHENPVELNVLNADQSDRIGRAKRRNSELISRPAVSFAMSAEVGKAEVNYSSVKTLS